MEPTPDHSNEDRSPEESYPTKSDIKRLRDEVVETQPKAKGLFDTVWNDDYLKIVMTRKRKNKTRSFEYSVYKLRKAVEYRGKYEIDKLYSKEGDNLEMPSSISEACVCGSLYWRDFDIEGRPILWVRNSRKNWRTLDVDLQRRLHIWMIEWGLHHIPEGHNQFVIVADTSNLTTRQIAQMSYHRMLINVFMSLYPDRVKYLLVGPCSMLLRKLYSLCLPLLPENVRDKIRLLPSDSQAELKNFMDECKIPDFFGGKGHHSFSSEDEKGESKEKFSIKQMASYQIEALKAFG